MTPQEREKYRLHAGLPVHRRRVARAMEAVRRALAEVPGEWGVGVSGGKDSTVLAHLAWAAGWRGRLFNFTFAEDPPENGLAVAALAAALGTQVVAVPVPGAFDVYDRLGRFFAVAETEEERGAVAAMNRDYKRAAEAGAVAAGFVGLFWGLRREESRARAITLAKYGTLYQARSRSTWTCCPLSEFTARDVWAYILARGLPWLPVYDASDDRERERSETTWLAAEESWRRGQGQRIRERDPALWQRLCERWPDLTRWG